LPSAIVGALKRRAEEKKRKTAEKALRQQNEELTKINKELDQFVYSVSHNLRSPLMSVLGLLNLARTDLQEKKTAHFEEYFRMMDESVNKLDETLKEIIDYSKNSRIEVLKEKISIVKLLEGCFRKLKYLEGADGFESRIRTIDSESFYSDPYRLSVVFTNLISNAIKYRDFNKTKSFIHIDFTTDQSITKIRVEDNGIGIDPRYLPHIFEMFYRATSKSQGAGLGLYIAKQMIENLGGTISVESTLQVGTTFTVEIPSGKDRDSEVASASMKLHAMLQRKQEHEQGREQDQTDRPAIQ
jgi:signal transduction histidine kinase